MMKKIFSFFAVAALMGMMVACGGSSNDESSDNGKKDSKNGKDGKESDGKEFVEKQGMNNNEEGYYSDDDTYVVQGNGSGAYEMAMLTDNLIKVMEQEPNAANFKNFMRLTMGMQQMLQTAQFTEEEVNQALANINPAYADDAAMERKIQSLQSKWLNWGNSHQEEAERITMEVLEEMGMK